jgi:ribonucleotide reductase alpha subunit
MKNKQSIFTSKIEVKILYLTKAIDKNEQQWKIITPK